jgi:hypothetical protein
VSQESLKHDLLWIASEICYYLGLLMIIVMPAVTFALYMINLADKIELNYWYLLIAWISSVLLFIVGIALKNYTYSSKDKN